MRVLVIGASGFIGRYLARRLGSMEGVETYCSYRSRPPEDDRNHWYQVELTDPVAVEKVFGMIRPDLVVHLAAMADVGACEREQAGGHRSQRSRHVGVGAALPVHRGPNAVRVNRVRL